MCLAIVKPAGVALAKDALMHAARTNADGCGFAVRCQGKIEICKGLWSGEELWRRVTQVAHLDTVVHLRWATQGGVTRDNCHPFALHGGGALIHNGHLDGFGTSTQSDTAHWVEAVLNPLLATVPDALAQPAIVRLLEASLHGDKMALLLPTQTLILNEAHGHWHAGAWWSNTSYRAPKAETWTMPAWQRPQARGLWDVDDDADDETRCAVCLEAYARTLPVCVDCLSVVEDLS